MQQLNSINYSFSFNLANKFRKEKDDRKPQKRRKEINYIDTIYTTKINGDKNLC